MAIYPKLQAYDAGMEVIDVFRGLNRDEKISEGEWSDEMNLTADRFPMLSVRGQRSLSRYYSGYVVDMLAKDALYTLTVTAVSGESETRTLNLYRDSERVYYQTYATGVKEPTGMVSFGAYIIILGANIWFNTADGTSGRTDMWNSLIGGVHVFPADENGMRLLPRETLTAAEGAAKEADENHGYTAGQCYVTSDTHVIRQYTEDGWKTVDNRARIEASDTNRVYEDGNTANEPRLLQTGDIVTLTGFRLEALNGQHSVSFAGFGDAGAFLVVDGVFVPGKISDIYQRTDLHRPRVSVGDMPQMDYVIECQNRLWGCFYGERDGKLVNEIYATELGDFMSWRNYDGTSMASYAASVGTDGPWTGAVSFQGKPHFFKEKHVHKVYISAAGAHQIVDTQLLGVQEGCAKSLTVLDGVLYYMSRDGVCAYDGSTPQVISEALRLDPVTAASFGGAQGKLYCDVHTGATYRDKALYTYDTKRGIWHIEERPGPLAGGGLTAFANLGDSFFACREGVDYDITKQSQLYDLHGVAGNREDEQDIFYRCVSGLIGWQTVEQKYISRFDMRLTLPQGATMKVEIEYDSSGTWEEQGTVSGSGTGSIMIPVRPRRCDHFRLRLTGYGEMRMFSFAKRLQKGSDAV